MLRNQNGGCKKRIDSGFRKGQDALFKKHMFFQDDKHPYNKPFLRRTSTDHLSFVNHLGKHKTKCGQNEPCYFPMELTKSSATYFYVLLRNLWFLFRV